MLFIDSSIASNESVEGHYNIGAFNPELDTDLDLEMFTQQGTVVPISTSCRNEQAISYINPRLLHDSTSNDLHQQNERVYENQDNPQRRNKRNQKEVIYDNQLPKGKVEAFDNTRSNIYEDTAIFNGKANNAFDGDDGEGNTLTVPVHKVPVYAEVDMSKKTHQPSVDSAPELPHYPDDISDDLSDVPYPDEMPQMERTWTTLSEFNFPPPPEDPPPMEPEEEVDTPRQEDTPNIVPLHEEPSYKPPTNNNPRGNGLKKKRMIASWAETEDEPMGNLWETVDKELDRRLGTT